MTGAAGRRFAGKTAMVTGGARGIGFAIAQRLAAEGADVAILDLNGPAAEAAAAKLAGADSRAFAIACDVADAEAMDDAAREIQGALGGLDMLVANAGLHLSSYVKPVCELSATDWRRMLDVNVLGVVNAARSCRAAMRQRGGGAIVTISSMAGYKAENAYGISKLAVRGLTVALARDFAADGIRVCGVAPGLIGSEEVLARFPEERRLNYVNNIQFVRRLGDVADIAGTVAFLLSDEASFITGETILVTGGAQCRI